MLAGLVSLTAAMAGMLAPWIHTFDLLANLILHSSAFALVCFLAARRTAGALAGIACLLLSAAIAWSGFDLSVTGAAPPGSVARAATLRIVTYNMTGARFGPDAVQALAALPDVDVIVLTETGRGRALIPQLRKEFPHATPCASRESCSLTILSKHPVCRLASWPRAANHPEIIRADILAGGQILALYAVDLRAPRPSARQYRQFEALAAILARQPGAKIVTGDFNAVSWSPGIRHLSVHAALQHPHGYAASWPSILGPFGVAIDHVLVSQGLDASAPAAIAVPLRSDHRPVGVEIAIPGMGATQGSVPSCPGMANSPPQK